MGCYTRCIFTDHVIRRTYVVIPPCVGVQFESIAHLCPCIACVNRLLLSAGYFWFYILDYSQPISDFEVFKNPIGVNLGLVAVPNDPPCKEYLIRGGSVMVVM